MKAFFEQIKTKINTDLPRYKTVDLYNNQDVALENLDQGRIVFPAVFIDFEFISVNQLALGIKNMEMVVRFRFLYENYTTGSRVDDLDLMTEFTNFFDLYRGQETDPLQFTAFHETLRGLDKDHDMVNFPFIEYSTMYRNQENYTRKDQVCHAPVAPDVDGETI